MSAQDAQRPGSSPSMPRTGVGGTTVGVSGEAGRFLRPRVGVGVEFTLPARIEAVQLTNYFQVYETAHRYRDVTLSGVVHVYAPHFHALRFGAVGGAGLVQESTLQRRRDSVPYGLFTGNFGSYGPETESTRWTIGATIGGDLEIGVSRHASVVPQIRMHWVMRSTSTQDAL
jgi:hypothetical protein